MVVSFALQLVPIFSNVTFPFSSEELTYLVVTRLSRQVATALVAAAEVATAPGDINYFMFW